MTARTHMKPENRNAMKSTLIALVTAIAGAAIAGAGAIKAPNGGRVIESVEPHAEFLVSPERKLEIRFLDHDGKVVAPAAQVVTVVMGERSNPTKLAFTKDGDKLVSDQAIPDGKNLPVVLQIRASAADKAVTSKFNLNLATCPECKHGEYACACDHGDDHEGHDH